MANTENHDHSGTAYFWFMAIQKSVGTSLYVRDWRGLIGWKPGATRLTMFDEIKADVVRRDPSFEGGTVIAFDIQPNEL